MGVVIVRKFTAVEVSLLCPLVLLTKSRLVAVYIGGK
jgi:hypothetical protein